MQYTERGGEIKIKYEDKNMAQFSRVYTVRKMSLISSSATMEGTMGTS